MRPGRARVVKKKVRKRTKFRLLLAYAQLMLLLMLGAGIGIVGAMVYGVWKVLPHNYDMNTYSPIEATRIYSSDGILLGAVYEENREVVPFNKIPKDLINAIVAVEDSRFYQHVGVDLRGIARAVVQNVRGGKFTQGGSTLTQQLARNIYLTQKKTISRKLQEAVLAIKIERNYSKDQILELYLNQVFFGSGAYGIETASKIYFGKSVTQLSLAQCALIAGLPQSPSASSPYVNPDRAIKRRNVVLDEMYEQGYISSRQYDDAKAEPLRLAGLKKDGVRYRAPYFVSYVMRELAAKYGEDLIYKGGLRVYTSLNYQMQQAAEKTIQNGVRNAKSYRVSQAALVSLDPKTGYIKAMVGGVDYSKSEFNCATQARRQPGSSFKAFVYTAAVDKNVYGPNTGPSSMVSNVPIRLPDGKLWPKNAGHRGAGGRVSMRSAVALSINIPAARTGLAVGIPDVIKYARMLGIKSPLDSVSSLALGSSGVTPLEMASAYGVFAAGGYRAEPAAIVKVVNSEGGIIEEAEPMLQRVLSSRTADVMDGLLRAVVTSGTGGAVRAVRDARGKTGTTSENKDVWFIGYIPNKMVTAIWAGNDTFTAMRGNAYGGTICAPMWREYTQEALEIQKRWANKNQPPKQATESRDDRNRRNERERPHETQPEEDQTDQGQQVVRVRICNGSEELATPNCTSTRVEAFIAGFEPSSLCHIHGLGNNTPTHETPNSGETTPNPPTETPDVGL
ncbi:MAG: penicillin-binding protein 1A [Armatimonadota bacterium]|nr:penicillin-binding protein 1A [Armatimonadota bacterium]